MGTEYYSQFAGAKEAIIIDGLAHKKRAIKERERWGKKLRKTVEYLMKRAHEGLLSPTGTKHLLRKQRELALYTEGELSRKAKHGRLVAIQTGGKSNKVFFRKPAYRRKKIRNMSISDDIAGKDGRTDDQSTIEEICQDIQRGLCQKNHRPGAPRSDC